MEQNIVLTGAGRGLGLSIAKELVAAGYFVIGIGRTRTEEFQGLVGASSDSPRGDFIEFDLANIDDIPELVVTIRKKHKTIYGLINNAALGNDGLLITQHQTEIEQLIKVNLQAPIILTKYVVRMMLAKKEGRVINVTSVVATTGYKGLAAYGATKAGLEGFTRSFSRDVGRANITVNNLAPGFMRTKMTEGLEGEKLQSIARRSPLGLPVTDEVAKSAVFLLSDAARMITGTTLTVDGGGSA